MAQLLESIAPRGGGRQLLLVGSGHGHLQLLARLAAQPLAGVQVTLVAPLARQFCAAMLPGFVAGDYTLADCAVELAPLLRHAAVRSHQGRVVRLDAQARSLQLDDGGTLGYDWLSLDPGPLQDRDRIERAIPGAREHGLFVRPIEAFGALWPRVTAMAPERLRSLAVIGSGVTGIELAMAIRQRLPQAAITLVAGGFLAGPACPAALRQGAGRQPGGSGARRPPCRADRRGPDPTCLHWETRSPSPAGDHCRSRGTGYGGAKTGVIGVGSTACAAPTAETRRAPAASERYSFFDNTLT